MTNRFVRTTVVAVLAALVSLALALPAFAGGDWNDDDIDWVAYEKALEQAKKEDKPILLVFYTDWCPHCTNYSKVFHDEKVIDKAKKFVMVRLNKDQNKELSAKFNPDGEYIPRTYFLGPKGDLAAEITANRPQYKYFYDVVDPASLLDGMDRALAKLGAS